MTPEEHLATAIANHKAKLEALRLKSEPLLYHDQAESGAQAANLPAEAAVEVIEEVDEDTAQMGPMAFAKHLCIKAALTSEQKGPVLLIAKDMQHLYDQELVNRGMQAGTAEKILLPVKGKRLRVLIFGGGGCGKTTIINGVLTPLFRRFFGPQGGSQNKEI